MASTPSMVLETESAHVTCPLLEILANAMPTVWLARGSTTTPPIEMLEWKGATTEALPSGWEVTTARENCVCECPPDWPRLSLWKLVQLVPFNGSSPTCQPMPPSVVRRMTPTFLRLCELP